MKKIQLSKNNFIIITLLIVVVISSGLIFLSQDTKKIEKITIQPEGEKNIISITDKEQISILTESLAKAKGMSGLPMVIPSPGKAAISNKDFCNDFSDILTIHYKNNKTKKIFLFLKPNGLTSTYIYPNDMYTTYQIPFNESEKIRQVLLKYKIHWSWSM